MRRGEWVPLLALLLLWWWCWTALRRRASTADAAADRPPVGPCERRAGVAGDGDRRGVLHLFAGWLNTRRTFRRLLSLDAGAAVFHPFGDACAYDCAHVRRRGPAACLVGFSLGCRPALLAAAGGGGRGEVVVLLAPVLNLPRDLTPGAAALRALARGVPDAALHPLLRAVARWRCDAAASDTTAHWCRAMTDAVVAPSAAPPPLDAAGLVRAARGRGVRVVVVRADRDAVAAWHAADWADADAVEVLAGAGHDVTRTHAAAVAAIVRRHWLPTG